MLLSKDAMKFLLLLLLVLLGITIPEDIEIYGVIQFSNYSNKRDATNHSQLNNCDTGNCSNYSFASILVNFTNDTTVYITSEMELSAIIIIII